MNYYFDLDNTLYETARLTTLMVGEIAKNISDEKKMNFDEVLEEIKPQFNSTNDNIFSYAEKMANKYEIDSEKVVKAVNDIIFNGEGLVFEDARNFLKKAKEKGHKLILLTYTTGNQEYQLQKIFGAKIAGYFEQIIVTAQLKYTLDIDYKNGVFFDDDPRDLKGLYEQNPIKVIRIRKPNNKRSKIDMDNKDIEEFESFDDIDM